MYLQLTYVEQDVDNALESVTRTLIQRLLVQTRHIQLPAKDHYQRLYSLVLPLHEFHPFHHGDDDLSAHYHVNDVQTQLLQPNLLYLEILAGNSQILVYISWCHSFRPMIVY